MKETVEEWIIAFVFIVMGLALLGFIIWLAAIDISHKQTNVEWMYDVDTLEIYRSNDRMDLVKVYCSDWYVRTIKGH